MTTFGLRARGSSLNWPLALTASVLIALAEFLLHPTIILVFFVSELSDSLRAIGLIVTVGLLGWYIPQVISPWLEKTSSRQMPWALGASLVRAASVIFLAYVGYRSDISDDERLRSFFICYVAYCVASGFAQAPVNELLSRSIPGEQLGRLMSHRNFLSGVIAICAGFVARQSLGDGGPDFPRNVTLLFIAAAAAVSGATFFLARIREPQAFDRTSLAPRFGDLAAVLRDGAFRRFALFGLIAAAATMADAFYVVFARREYNLPSAYIGTFLIVFATGAFVAAPCWSALARRTSARASIQTAIAIRVIAPLVVLVLPYALDTDLYRDNVTNDRVVFYILAVPFAIHGIALRGFVNGNFRYVMSIAVPERRIAYQVLALTPLAMAAAAPLIGAWVIDRWNYERLFIVTVFAGLLAILAGGLLADTSMRVRTTARAWRLRDARP